MTVKKTDWLLRSLFLTFLIPTCLFASNQPQESSEPRPSNSGIENEIVRDEDLMQALLAEDLDTMRDAAIRLIERANKSQEKLDTFFGEAFEKFQENPERLSELLGIFDYFNLFSRAAYRACETFMKTQQPQHPAWDEIARSYFHQKFLINAVVWRAKIDNSSEEELLMIRLYNLPVDLWLLRSILTQPENFSEGVQLAAIDALWWVYAMGRIEIHESLVTIFENKNTSARVFEAAVEPLEYLYSGFAYPQIIPYMQKALQSKAMAETSEEHREKINDIVKQYTTHAETYWSEQLKEFEGWFKREEALRALELESQPRETAASLRDLKGRWLLDKISCVLENGDEVFIESFENLNLPEFQEILKIENESRFEITKSSGRNSTSPNQIKLQKLGAISGLDATESQYLFRTKKEIIQEAQDRQEFELSMLESIERSFEAKLEMQTDVLVLTVEKTLKSLGSTDLCLSLKGMKQRKYFKKLED